MYVVKRWRFHRTPFDCFGGSFQNGQFSPCFAGGSSRPSIANTSFLTKSAQTSAGEVRAYIRAGLFGVLHDIFCPWTPNEPFIDIDQ